jgi:hypothetical protein
MVELFLICFPWLNHRENAREDTLKNILSRLGESNSITLVAHFDVQLAVILRGHMKESREFVIDAFCTNDTTPLHLRAQASLAGYRLMLPKIIQFAFDEGAEKLSFDTHLSKLPTVFVRMIRRLNLPMQYLGAKEMGHAFRFIHKSEI